MNVNIVIIGDGQLAKMLCSFPGVLGYVKPKELEMIYSIDDEKIGRLDPKIHRGVIGIADPKFKKESTEEWLNKGFKLGLLIHPQATILGDPDIGLGSVVFPQAFVDDECRIGKSTYIGGHTVIHKSKIGDYAHLTFGCQIIFAQVGEGAIIGSNVTVLDGRKVGKYSIVGAGSVVYQDVLPRHKLIQKRENIMNPIEEFNWTEKRFKRK